MEKIWQGVIVLAYKCNPLKILILQNTVSGNTTLLSGAQEDNEELNQTAQREIYEEVGWTVDVEDLEETGITHSFTYGKNKPERAGHKGINHVFLLNATNLPAPKETSDTKNARWIDPKTSLEQISFEDLREVVLRTLIYIK